MARSIKSFFTAEKNQKIILVGALILLGIYLLKPDLAVQLTTQSILGLTIAGYVLSFSFVMIALGVLLMFFPPTFLLGLLIVAVSTLVGSFAFIAGLNNLIPGIKLGTWGIYIIIIFIGYKLYKKHLA